MSDSTTQPSEEPMTEPAATESGREEEDIWDEELLVEEISIDGMCGVY